MNRQTSISLMPFPSGWHHIRIHFWKSKYEIILKFWYDNLQKNWSRGWWKSTTVGFRKVIPLRYNMIKQILDTWYKKLASSWFFISKMHINQKHKPINYQKYATYEIKTFAKSAKINQVFLLNTKNYYKQISQTFMKNLHSNLHY